jgi:ComF family protein
MILKQGIHTLLDILKNFAALAFPDTCCACGTILFAQETHLCLHCRALLPKTRFHKNRENHLTKIFWGRLQLETGTSLYYFQKGGKVQRLIHQFKYKGNTKLGFYLGQLLGRSIRLSSHYKDIDCIIPVPLHPKRERRRGFNQSAVIASGIASSLSVPCPTHLLVRKEYTETQTRKNRFSRWQNVAEVFETPEPEALINKSVLLVDDVITTGSTLEACAQKLLAIKGVRVWIATLAITSG